MKRRRDMRAAIAAILLLSLSVNAAAIDAAALGQDSNLPLPRYVSLKSQGANGRQGPGLDQQIAWIYERPGLPLQVTAESGPWRRVRDPDGVQVWMHAQNLDPRRTVYVRDAATGDVALRSQPRANAGIVAYLANGVVGPLTACDGAWRRVAVGGRVGWVAKEDVWGGEDCRGL